MTEARAGSEAEMASNVEIRSARERSISAFNNAGQRWANKIYSLHRSIDPGIEIDDLADTGLLNDEQKGQFASYRRFEKGVRSLNRDPYLSLYDDDKRQNTLNVSFKDPETGEVHQREEGLDVSDLIASAKDDVEKAKAELAERKASRWSSPQMVGLLENQVRQYEEEARLLEENSIPYPEAFPNALDENDPVERARIAEEARRIWKNPLTNTGSNEGNWQAAKTHLAGARLLQMPAKEEPKEVPLSSGAPTVVAASTYSSELELLPIPVAAEPAVTEGQSSIPEEWVAEGVGGSSTAYRFGGYEPRGAGEPTAGSDNRTGFAPDEQVEDGARDPDLVIPPLRRETRSPGSPSVTIDGQFSELGGPGYASRFGVFMRDLIDSGAQGADVLVNRIREFRQRWGERESRVDPVTARKVDTLMRIKSTDEQRDKRRLVALPLVLLLLAGIPRDTKGAVPSSSLPIPVVAEAPKAPPSSEVRPLPVREPKTIQEFRDGRGLENAQYAWNDYTVREDYEKKLEPNNPNANAYYIEGYSVKGLTESDLAEAMNPNLAAEFAKLEAEGKPTSEEDTKMLKTLYLMKEQLDGYYGPGTFDRMVSDFSARMGNSIMQSNVGVGYRYILPIVDSDKIVEGRIKKWQITDNDLAKWFGLKTDGTNLNPDEWKNIREKIITQVSGEEKTNE